MHSQRVQHRMRHQHSDRMVVVGADHGGLYGAEESRREPGDEERGAGREEGRIGDPRQEQVGERDACAYRVEGYVSGNGEALDR